MPFQAVATHDFTKQVAGQGTDLVARGEFKRATPAARARSSQAARGQPANWREAMIALEIAASSTCG